MLAHDNIFSREFTTKPTGRSPARSFGLRRQRSSVGSGDPKEGFTTYTFLPLTPKMFKKVVF
jgi:hypothetical protein